MDADSFVKVVVHVWTSAGNRLGRGRQGNQGHVSLTFVSNVVHDYVSWVPEMEWHKRPKGFWEKLLGKAQGHFQPNVSADVDDEMCPPTFVFCFYSLDVPAMEAELQRIKKSAGPKLLWTSCGDLFSFGFRGFNFRSDAESCASLAWTLLCVGGINQLVSTKERLANASEEASAGAKETKEAVSKHSKSDADDVKNATMYTAEQIAAVIMDIQSPDVLAKTLQTAKANELERFPFMAGFEPYICGYTGIEEYRPQTFANYMKRCRTTGFKKNLQVIMVIIVVILFAFAIQYIDI